MQVPGNTQAELHVPVPEGTSTLYVDRVPHEVGVCSSPPVIAPDRELPGCVLELVGGKP